MLLILWLFLFDVFVSIAAYTIGVPKGYYSTAAVITGDIISLICFILLSIIFLSTYSKEERQERKYYWL